MHPLVPCTDVVVNWRGQNVRKYDERIEHDHEDDQVKKKFDDMQIGPVKPPHVLGRFANFNVPDHTQQIICVEAKHVKGKDVEGQCYKKRDNGEDQERKMAKAEAHSPDMEPPTFRQGRDGFEHV